MTVDEDNIHKFPNKVFGIFINPLSLSNMTCSAKVRRFSNTNGFQSHQTVFNQPYWLNEWTHDLCQANRQRRTAEKLKRQSGDELQKDEGETLFPHTVGSDEEKGDNDEARAEASLSFEHDWWICAAGDRSVMCTVISVLKFKV